MEAPGDSDSDYEVHRLAPGEDLVIDGETAIDDLLVAQRVAERETLIASELQIREQVDGPGAEAANPSRTDVKRLMRLLRQANELSQRISSLPPAFDDVMGGEVRAACRATAQAMEKLPAAEVGDGDDDDDESEEQDESAQTGGAAEDAAATAARQAKALEGLDLDTTTEEENEEGADAKVAARPKLEPCVGADEEEVEGDADGDEEEANENSKESARLSNAIAQAGFQEIADESQDEAENDGEPSGKLEPIQIRTDGIPERLAADDEMEALGEASAIVDGLLVVRGSEGSKALDLQSVVCLEDRVVVGVVVDVFGPVVQPHYLIFPTVKDQALPEVGSQLFAATGLEETSYLCDAVAPHDIAALRRGLLGDVGEDYESGDEMDEDLLTDDEQNAEENESGAVGALEDFDAEARLTTQRPGKAGKSGKGEGKDGKDKGKGKRKGGKDKKRQRKRQR